LSGAEFLDNAGELVLIWGVLASFKVELKYLAHLTGDARYWKAADGVTRLMQKSVRRIRLLEFALLFIHS
jgi:hypothetical protein